MKKRLLASLLSLAMLLTMLPVTAFAADAADTTGISITKDGKTQSYDTLYAAINAAADGDVIDVSGEITETAKVLTIPADRTIQINGGDKDSPAKISTTGTWVVNGALGLGKNLTLNLSNTSVLDVEKTGYIVVGTVPDSNVTIEGDGSIEGKSDRPIRVVEGESSDESTADNAEEDGAENVFDPVLKLDTTFSSPNYYAFGLRAGQVIIGENAELDVKSIFVGDMGIEKSGKRGSNVDLTEDCTLDVYGTVTNESTPATTGKEPWQEEATITTYGVVKDKTMTINIHDGATVTNKFTSALYLPANGKCTIGDESPEEGKDPPVIKGGTAAIGLKSGSLTINSGTITATQAAGTEMDAWNNGINENGSAIVIESNKNYKGEASVTVKDAEIIGAANAFYFISTKGEPGTEADVTLTIENGTFRSPNAYTFGMTEETPSTPPAFPVIKITDGTFTNYVPTDTTKEPNIDKVEAYIEPVVNGKDRACRVDDGGETFSVADIIELGSAAVELTTEGLSTYSKLPEGTTNTPNVTVSKTEWFNQAGTKVTGTVFGSASVHSAKVTVTPAHGYTFSKDAKFTVNGKETTPESFDETADEDRVLPVTGVVVNVDENPRTAVNVQLSAESGVETSPLESIDVAIYNRDESTNEPVEGESPVETGKTNNTGKVAFVPGFVKGKYIAVVAAKGTEYAHSTATFELPPTTGTEITVPLTLKAAAKQVEVTGGVTLTGVDTSGITITFTDANGDKWTVTTGNGGGFKTNLPAGEYTVTIEGTDKYETYSDTYTVKDEENTFNNLSIELEAKATTFTVSGTVSAGDTNADLSSLTVKLTGDGVTEQSANVDAEGNFSFAAKVPNGTYTLTIAAGEGHKSATGSVTVNGADVTAPAITLEKPAESTPETSDSESETSKPETSDSESETSDDETSGDETSEAEIVSVEIDIDDADIEVGDDFPTPKLTTVPANAAEISTTWQDASGKEVNSAVSAGLYTATFVITPNKGYKFGEGTSYRINNDTDVGPDSLTVSLNVAEKPATQYSLNIPQPENGAVAALVNGESASTAAAGDTVTLDITPDDGYKLLSVVMDGVVLDPEVLTFTMPAADVDIQVTFVEEQKVVAEVDPVDPDAGTIEVSAAPTEGDIKNQIESSTEAFVQITTGAIKDGDGKEVVIPTNKPVTVEVTVPQEDSEALKESNKGLNVEIPNVITAAVPAEPLSDILADKPESEGVVFVCDRETVETDKAVFEIGFETTSGTKLPYTANSGLITLKVKVPFAPGVKIVITSEGKPVAQGSNQAVATDGTVTFGTDHMSPFEFIRESAVVVPSDDYEITYPYRGSAKISINAVANEQYIIQVTVEGKAVPFVTTAPNTTTNPTLDVNAPIGSKVEVWRVPAGDDPFTALGAVGPTATELFTIASVPAAD